MSCYHQNYIRFRVLFTDRGLSKDSIQEELEDEFEDEPLDFLLEIS